MTSYLKLQARGVQDIPMSVDLEYPSKYFLKDSPGYVSLPGYLINLGLGTEATPFSKFFTGMDRSQVLDIAMARIRCWDDIPELQNYDLSRVTKYGPQGALPPLATPSTVELFRRYYDYCRNPCRVPDYVYKHMKRKYSEADLQPMTYQEVVDRAQAKGRYHTQGGAPYYLAKDKTIPEGIALAEAGGLGDRDVVVVGERAIRQGLRFIYMAAQSTSLRELRWIVPLQDWMRDHNDCYAALKGQDAVEVETTKWWNQGPSIFLSGDYTKMDTTCGIQQYLFFYEVTKWAWPRRYWKEYRNDLLHAINVPAVVGCVTYPGTPPTKGSPGTKPYKKLVVVKGTHSNQSGDAWNQTLEDILSESIHTQLRLEGFEDWYQLIGDDSIGIGGRHHTPAQLAERFTDISKMRGMICNVEKQMVSETSFKYLQRYFCPESYRQGTWSGAYPLIMATNSAKNPERDHITGREREREMQSIRYISIVENMHGHPRFHDAIDMFLEGDPNRLGLDDPALWKDNALYQSMRDKGLLPESSVAARYPEKLAEFETVKYLMRKC